jgi:mRNA interferase MazF
MEHKPGSDENIRLGDIWTVAFDLLRPVVLLSGLENGDFRCVVAVAPADEDISGVAVEVALGLNNYVIRVALPRAGQINCTWVTTSSPGDFVEKLGSLSSEKLEEIENLIRVGDELPS